MTSRIWLIEGEAGDGLPKGHALPEHALEALTNRLQEASERGVEPKLADLAAELDPFAGGPGADREVAVPLPAGGTALTVAAVLGVPPDAVVAHTATLDWTPGEAPQLIGVDLDWIPPFRPAARPKFPGGPGVAGSNRG